MKNLAIGLALMCAARLWAAPPDPRDDARRRIGRALPCLAGDHTLLEADAD